MGKGPIVGTSIIRHLVHLMIKMPAVALIVVIKMYQIFTLYELLARMASLRRIFMNEIMSHWYNGLLKRSLYSEDGETLLKCFRILKNPTLTIIKRYQNQKDRPVWIVWPLSWFPERPFTFGCYINYGLSGLNSNFLSKVTVFCKIDRIWTTLLISGPP